MPLNCSRQYRPRCPHLRFCRGRADIPRLHYSKTAGISLIRTRAHGEETEDIENVSHNIWLRLEVEAQCLVGRGRSRVRKSKTMSDTSSSKNTAAVPFDEVTSAVNQVLELDLLVNDECKMWDGKADIQGNVSSRGGNGVAIKQDLKGPTCEIPSALLEVTGTQPPSIITQPTSMPFQDKPGECSPNDKLGGWASFAPSSPLLENCKQDFFFSEVTTDKEELKHDVVPDANPLLLKVTEDDVLGMEMKDSQDKDEDEQGLDTNGTKRSRIGSYTEKDMHLMVGSGAKGRGDKLTEQDDDGWTDMSTGSMSFDFCSSDEEEEKNESKQPGAKEVGGGLAKQFDINLMVSSIAKGEKALDEIAEKDVVLVVGKTGTGKSTLIQALANRTLRKTSYECQRKNGKSVRKEVFEVTMEDCLPGFEIGHAKVSKTTHINCYNPAKDGTAARGCGAVFVDCPGLEDTNGHEVDIATSVMLSEVAKRCKSLRFLILINFISLLEDRGGSMRSVLRLVRSFSDDFEADKPSFMFIFTHTNEVAGIPGTLVGSKASLHDEIIHLIHGTAQDEEILCVLKFIEKSLKRGYPFVDVFLPLDLQCAANIRKAIESKQLRPMKRVHLANNCGLSQGSRFTLTAELSTSLQNLKRHLSGEGEPDMEAVSKLLQLFLYFKRYLSTEDVRKTVEEAQNEVDKFMQEEKSNVLKEIDCGTALKCKFGPPNVQSIKMSLSHLQRLKETFPDQVNYDDLLPILKDKIADIQSIVKLDCPQDVAGITRVLHNLRIWSEGFPEIASCLYCATVDQVGQHFVEISSRVQEVASRTPLCLLSVADIHGFVQDVYMLQSIKTDANALAEHAIDVSRISWASSSALTCLREEIESLRGSRIVSKVKITLGSGEYSLSRLVKIVGWMEALASSLQKFPISHYVSTELLRLHGKIAGECTDCFEELFSDLSCDDFTVQTPSLQSRLTNLRAASDGFCDLCNDSCWKYNSSVLQSCNERVKAMLRTKSGEIEEMSLSAREHGIRDGRREAEMLVSYTSLSWFDYLLPADECFVTKCAISVERIYQERISFVKNQAFKALRQVMKTGDSHESFVSAVKELNNMLPEIEEMSFLATVMKDEELCCIKGKLTAELQGYMEAWNVAVAYDVQCWRADVRKFVENTHEGNVHHDTLDACTLKMDCALQDVCILRDLAIVDQTVLRSIKTHVQDACKAFSSSIRPVIEGKGKYRKKFYSLLLVERLQGFFSVAGLLPPPDELQKIARNSVAAEAKEIEDLVSQSAEWDKIDLMLTRFEKTSILDKFTSDEASSRLRPLLQLREQKETQVDELLEKLISNQNYAGIKEFIVPYATTEDQIKRQKFQQWCGKIVSSLCAVVYTINEDLERPVSEEVCQAVARQLRILEQAHNELSAHLRDVQGGLNIEKEIKTVKERINQRARAAVSAFSTGHKKLDFKEMGLNIRALVLASSKLDACFSHANRQAVKDVGETFLLAKQSVSSSIARFVRNGFQDNDYQVRKILSSLKNAFESSNPSFPKLSKLYEDSQKNLTEMMNECFKNCRDLVMDSPDNLFYAVDVMGSLDRQLKTGLKDHVLVSRLCFDCEVKLAEWREMRRNIDRELDFGGKDAEEKLKKWSSLLDRLDAKSGWVSSAFTEWKSGTTYDQKLMGLGTKVGDKYKQGQKALKDSDFLMVQDCIHVLTLMDHHIKRHLPFASKMCSDLKKQALETFLAVSDKAQSILQSKNKIHFEGAFSDFRGLVLYVPCVMESAKAKRAFTLTNQFVHEAFVKDVSDVEMLLESFEFEKARGMILSTRRFGGFLVDRYTILHESLKTLGHLEMDQWVVKIVKLGSEYFSFNRSLQYVQHFAVLEVAPSADETAIKKAYKLLAKRSHPDKTGQLDSAQFRKVKEAHDYLLAKIDFSSRLTTEQPFDTLLQGVATMLREKAKSLLEDQRYDTVAQLLFRLGDLKTLDDLVDPSLDHCATVGIVQSLIKGYVEKTRVDVDSNWASRKYRALNENITDLKLMEAHFKTYTDVFSCSWNQGIIKHVEQEIESLGQRARGYLTSHRSAKDNQDDFRRCFLQMGHVLVELPLFKENTKQVMCDVLGACLYASWGYSFLFEFGLNLQRGDDSSSEEDNQVAQVIVAEFTHFKEVMTMVWNEETTQKPVQDTVKGIRGQIHKGSGRMVDLPVNCQQLLASFEVFETEYKKLLGEYIPPEADLQQLAHKTVALASKLWPLDCNSGWGSKVRCQIPYILAAVFTVFTVRKSGESYNRLSGTEGGGGASGMGDKLLMKPHNIQVLTLLSLFGCASSSQSTCSLDSQLMQIRTGEGKSMILGAAAVMLALLGFEARCVCYSEYLSERDFSLFCDVFNDFGVRQYITYSKITTLSEDATAAKGDIRGLTIDLLQGNLGRIHVSTSPLSSNSTLGITGINTGTISAVANGKGDHYAIERQIENGKLKRSSRSISSSHESEASNEHVRHCSGSEVSNPTRKVSTSVRREILLVDEVDVFFGSEFYGQTYNQVALLREPEVAQLLNHIWIVNKRGGCRQRLADIKTLPAYSKLLQKLPGFEYLLDSEISLMTDHVRHVNDEPYHLDGDTDRIGYKVMDTISYEATYGYRTVFAYLQEAEKGSLKNPDETLANALAIPVSCGRLSYANISPERILGVSGTLSALGTYEKDVLAKYGVNTFMYVPSVYGECNFLFDKGGDGIRVATTKSDYYHSITEQVLALVKEKRAVIVFFQDSLRLREFISSSFYRKLGRQKKFLTEAMPKADKEFVISKAATAGQVTLSTAVFGRGTDFFCKDETVQQKGGVHVIQTFLSEGESEEIQIQGRTARQGKKGSYQIILLDSDLEDQFELARGWKDKVAKERWYEYLHAAREKHSHAMCKQMEENLADATLKDKDTHRYFDALLARDKALACRCFKDIYTTFKKGSMPSSIELDIAFLVDLTGSMLPYAQETASIINSMLTGPDSIVSKLKTKYPDIEFQLRAGVLGFRDFDDGSSQFMESGNGQGHFMTDTDNIANFVQSILKQSSGGGDIAEDHLGAIDRCVNQWSASDDWTSPIKFMLLFTDAPAHGMVPQASSRVPNVDCHSVRHPNGLTSEHITESLLKNGIDMFLCSFNPSATLRMEQELKEKYLNHQENTEQREIVAIPLVQASNGHVQSAGVLGGHGKHIIFVLDQSRSMQNDWSGVVQAYNQFLARRRLNQCDSDLVSVVQFSSGAEATVRVQIISRAPTNLSYGDGGTCFGPAAALARELACSTPPTHVPVVVFMSDGCANDASSAASEFSQLNQSLLANAGSGLELHVIAFGAGASTAQLRQIAGASSTGRLHRSADTAELSNLFVKLAGCSQVAQILQTEIGKRISEAVSDRLAVEYTG